MNQRETDTSEQVLKFAPKEKAPNRVAQLDDAGQAIVAQIRTAADLAKEDCDRAMSLAHKLSMELRAAEDRTQQMAREVEHWRDRAARAEQWLRTIQQEIEEKLLTRRSFSGGRGGRNPLVWIKHSARCFRQPTGNRLSSSLTCSFAGCRPPKIASTMSGRQDGASDQDSVMFCCSNLRESGVHKQHVACCVYRICRSREVNYFRAPDCCYSCRLVSRQIRRRQGLECSADVE